MRRRKFHIIANQTAARATLQPLAPNERMLALDLMRGFAMGGVLAAYALWNLGSPPASTYSAVEQGLDKLLALFIDTKCYTLLAFLFGLGFSLQYARAAAQGESIVPIYRRRLGALALIGLTHALLLRNGDILVPYAAMGFVLLPMRNASARTLALATVLAFIFPYVAQAAWQSLHLPVPQRPNLAGASYLVENLAWVRYWYATAFTSWPKALPLFLAGHLAGSTRLFIKLEQQPKILRRVLLFGFSVSMLAYAMRSVLLTQVAPALLHHTLASLLWHVHAWGLAACYAAVFLLVARDRTWAPRFAPLAAVGRMALTNYLLQALLLVPTCLVFHLFDHVTPTVGLLLALAVWCVQIVTSVLWLRHFRFGPAEWLWRSLTYGQVQPLRLKPNTVHLSKKLTCTDCHARVL